MPTTKIQGSDVKSVSDLSNDKTKLITTEKIYDVNNLKTLAEAITDGDIGGGGGGSPIVIDPDQSIQNSFTAKILNSGSASIGSQGPVNFIQSVNRTSAGTVSITWTPGFFTVAPAVFLTEDDTTQAIAVSTNGSTNTTGTTIHTMNTSSLTLTDRDFNIQCVRQGADEQDVLSRLSGGGLASEVYSLRHEVSSGSSGGTSLAAGTVTRTLNIIEGTGSNVTVNPSSQMTFQPGTYAIIGSASVFRVRSHKSFLYNVTDASVLVEGTSEYADTGALSTDRSHFSKTFTLASAKVIEVRTYTQDAYAGNGLGASVALAGRNEVYVELTIIRVA